jgi:uncharacterized damage-inducible protein DinB
MLIQTLQSLFDRDLTKLHSEIEQYQSEEALWQIEKGIANSAGNLCLHLLGNLNAFIGAAIGKTNYVRNRAEEFTLKGIPKAELLANIDALKRVVKQSLDALTPEDLSKEYPILVFAEKTSTEYMLVHLATHLSYHLGQINYHRRLLDEPGS